ncbi:uncharacterized protein TNCV_2328371 [Trichonephila clavipes]|nr:uncharacterized protein TNCV_2328371 [Trichonephila clavipes]
MYGSSWHGGTLNSRCATSPLERFVEGKESLEAPDHHRDFLFQNWGETEPNYTVTCMMLKAKANDRCRNLDFSRDEFHLP